MADAFSMSLDLGAIERAVGRMSDQVGAAVRPAAQAAAQVLYDEVKANVRRIGKKTGALESAIYQAYKNASSGEKVAVYAVSWNKQKAPHGHLVEFGHIQRYAVYLGKNGQWYTAVRKGVKGKKKKPGRRASQAARDAYYVTLPAPRQVPAQSFLRAARAKLPEALEAARRELVNRVGVNAA